MGGSKNKSPAQKEKSQDSKKSDSKKSKKGDKSEGGSVKAEIRVTLTEQQAAKALKSSKVITVQELARQTGVKISAANAFLIEAAKKGTVKKVGGYSGHHIYQPVSA
ncbi:30S ribosomal protein S25 [Nitrosopumilus sp. b1]|uniref:MarR family transcriptional regulator n=1 Tax=Nitrosopumilus sp. b1 TaxID=2109907 RepID=UPI0015F5F0DD|nr:MarR family transcriptional regulator [Nitrosopumilus sp. b1]KAF6242027.1 30S ribosomal protein S25 [Nitrosopumilus sp. b1]